FLEDFVALCGACARAGVSLLPSLLSFESFMPLRPAGHGVLKRGRRRVILDDVAAFLDATLVPLLHADAAVQRNVFAFEVLNEPEWVVAGRPRLLDWPHHGPWPMPQSVPVDELTLLLSAAIDRIVHAGCVASIGFADGRVDWLPMDFRRRLIRLAQEGRYLHQHHHYPSWRDRRELPSAASFGIGPCILGELPTRMGNHHPLNPPWRDQALRDTEVDPRRYLTARLGLAARLGYRAALPWSVRGRDRHSVW